MLLKTVLKQTKKKEKIQRLINRIYQHLIKTKQQSVKKVIKIKKNNNKKQHYCITFISEGDDQFSMDMWSSFICLFVYIIKHDHVWNKLRLHEYKTDIPTTFFFLASWIFFVTEQSSFFYFLVKSSSIFFSLSGVLIFVLYMKKFGWVLLD